MKKIFLTGLLTNGARSRPCLHGHDRASEETKGIIPRGLPRKAAVGGGCRARQLCCRSPAVLYLLFAVLFISVLVFTGCRQPGDPTPEPDDEFPIWPPFVEILATGQKNEDGKWLNERPGYAPDEIRPDLSSIMDSGGTILIIRPNVKYQIMDGFGASDAWIVNYLFGGGVDPTGQGRYGPDITTAPYNQTYPGMHEEGKQQIADWLFSQEFDETTGEPAGIGLSQWRVYLGAGSWEQGNDSRIGVTHADNFANMNSNWQNRGESLLYEINDPMGTTPAVQAAIAGGSAYKHPQSGIVYDFRKMAGNQYLMNEARKRGTENFIVFAKSMPVPWTRNGFASPDARGMWLWPPFDRSPNIDTDNTRGNGPGEEMFANYLADSAEYFTGEGFNIQFISPFNEPQYDWSENKQEGSPGTNEVIARVARHLDAAIQDRPLIAGGTKIMLAEAARWDYLYEVSGNSAGVQIQAFFNPANINNPSAQLSTRETYIGDLISMQPAIIAGHSYFSHNTDTDTFNLRSRVAAEASQFTPPVRVYSTEWCALTPGSGFPNVNTYFRTALFNAKLTHQDITIANAVSYTFWTAVVFDHGHARYGLINNSPGVSQYDGGARSRFSVFHNESYNKTQPTLWGTGHWSLFVRPGFQRIALQYFNSGADVNDYMGLMGTAYISPAGFKDFVTGQDADRVVAVFVNMGTSSRWVAANITGDFGDGRVYGGVTGKHPKYIRVFITDFNNTESVSQNIIFREGVKDETGEIPAITAAARNTREGPASGYGMRRQLHDNGLVFIPRESIVTVVYDF